jgi:DNA-directed RNA polymerase subunit RPC12/RpoP
MKTLCETEGHFYITTLQGKSKRCTYCGQRRMWWSRESFSSIRAAIMLHRVAF